MSAAYLDTFAGAGAFRSHRSDGGLTWVGVPGDPSPRLTGGGLLRAASAVPSARWYQSAPTLEDYYEVSGSLYVASANADFSMLLARGDPATGAGDSAGLRVGGAPQWFIADADGHNTLGPPLSPSVGHTYALRFVLSATDMKLYVDGTLTLTAGAPTGTGRYVGLRMDGNTAETDDTGYQWDQWASTATPVVPSRRSVCG